MSKLKILFPDNLHFHKKNFKSLLDYIEKNKLECIMMAEYNEIKALYGNYTNYKSLFLNHYDQLISLDKEELFELKRLGANVFNLAKAELLSYLMSKENWFNCHISSDKQAIFNKAYSENKEELILNMAATLFWLDFWHRRMGFKSYKNINISIMFSGSLIYVKTLSYLLQNTPVRVFIVEHFFTGNDYYFEEKYEHIANNSDVKYNNFYQNLKRTFFEEYDVDKEKIKALNKINSSNNKNVKQPSGNNEINFYDESKKNVLILGQVVNDFSILETNLDNINSLDIYKTMILKVLKETSYNIIFKAHPWERNKTNLKRSITKDELTNYILGNLSEEHRKRIVIVEDFNIKELFKISNYIVGICSQSLLEAAYAGKKPHQIGKSFFGNKGFTYDHDSIENFIDIIKLKPKEKLCIDEYQNLLEFFAVVLQKHLVSIHQSGEKSIREKLSAIHNIKLIPQKMNSFLIPSLKKEETKELVLSDNRTSYNEIKDASFMKVFVENIVMTFASEKKIKKFKENPKRFFADTDHTFVKFLGQLYDK